MPNQNPQEPRTICESLMLGAYSSYLLTDLLGMCDHSAQATLRVEQDYDGFDNPAQLVLEWQRLETQQEVAARLEKARKQRASVQRAREARKQYEADQAAEQLATERALYEKLRAKFEPVQGEDAS